MILAYFILTFRYLIDIIGRKTRYRLPEDSISRKAQEITVKWNHERDNLGSPYDYTIGSGVKAWWHCAHGHDWKTAICDRIRGRGCPYCSNKLLLKGYNDLETMRLWITMRWDYFMNQYHDKKTAECKHAGIGLMFIWDDDWMNARNSMKRIVIDSIQHVMDIHDA